MIPENSKLRTVRGRKAKEKWMNTKEIGNTKEENREPTALKRDQSIYTYHLNTIMDIAS